MSEVNKLDNKQCPFDPDQYKIDTLAAPAGTSPWALIQVYLGNKVHRKDWSALDEYIHLVSGNGNDAPEIKKRDKHGVMTSWQPTQEDLMACDWELVKSEPKPEDCMLSFDITVGTGKFNDGEQSWGYLADNEFESIGESPFGTLANLQNKTEITKFLYFSLSIEGGIQIIVSSDNNQEGYQKMVKLFARSLTVTVNDVLYHLGSAITIASLNGKGQYRYGCQYDNADAHNLGTLLKQNVGKTLRFFFNWK
ncbi:DUF2829 domain-containing protein [Xenorhabdus bovienii]|uniref:Thoeris anti-defense Tad2 family protein n=1 Tax=Xenorhabdus bovienii TaxID=40576 RepID=UPI001EDEA755|nr:MW1434 family type I TA system toxin [Xenorhabdus bovienii]MCG3461519.1 DUF2829 domain-containing protein [Xenorhabdus bovienii]